MRLIDRGWRDILGGVASAASREMLVAAPYVKEPEAAWLRGRLRPGVDVLTLANLDAGAMAQASLDLAARGARPLRGQPLARRASALRRAMRRASRRAAGTQVGKRSPNAVFGEAIRYALRAGPLRTVAIQEVARSLYPELCDDEVELAINGMGYGRKWKYRVRLAQVHLRRRGEIAYDRATREWRLLAPPPDAK